MLERSTTLQHDRLCWTMEMNLRDCASASNLPYIFSFSDNVAVPSGGKKVKNTAQAIFGQHIFKMAQFNGGGGVERFFAWESQYLQVCSTVC